MSLDAPQLSGRVDATGMRIGIIVSRFNENITAALLAGAQQSLLEHGASESDLHTVHVPGALEIGTIAARMAESGDYDAIVCLGCVIRGDTAHFEHVCRISMDMIAAVAMRGDIAVGNGVLTVDTQAQAEARIGGAHGHKGAEAALTAIKVAMLLTQWEA
ncbi:MAG: 6,7-dimethyl-8-ribityllumazine synthase [Mariprofundaceae bacterium]